MNTREFPSLNLARLINEGGTAQASGQLDHLSPAAEATPQLQGPLTWKATVTAMEDQEFFLSGEVAGYVQLECARCLEATPAAVRGYFQYLLRYVPGTRGIELIEEDDEDILLVGDPVLDLTQILEENFLAAMPFRVLCQPDCPGICPDCGANLKHQPHQPDCRNQQASRGKLAGLEQFLPEQD